MRNSAKIPLLVVIGLVAAVLLVSGGVLLGVQPGVRDALRRALPDRLTGAMGVSSDYSLQDEILGKLESTYYKQIDMAALKTDAINGMVAGLDDPYTVYMDPSEYTSFNEHTSGSYSGIGMTVEMSNDRLVTIVAVFKGSPAQEGGIRPGDIIVAVDGVSTEGENLDEVVGRIKGTEGSVVVLTLYRPAPSTTTTTVETGSSTTTTASPGPSGTSGAGTSGDTTAAAFHLPPGGSTRDYSLTRNTIAVPVTESEMLTAAGGKRVALISFFTFSQGSAAELRAQVQEAVDTDHVSAIILDLRSNGGGLLTEAVDVASIFIPDGVVVTTQGLHSPKDVYNATGGAFSLVPLYVLTDGYTASASEIVSGALQDDKRATLVGETTFGKGLVQTIEPLSNGGAVKVTTAVYLTPKGRDINAKGVTPDVVAPDDPNTPNVDETVQAALDLIGSASVAK
jgi:carboxyl-terminal processing protease